MLKLVPVILLSAVLVCCGKDSAAKNRSTYRDHNYEAELHGEYEKLRIKYSKLKESSYKLQVKTEEQTKLLEAVINGMANLSKQDSEKSKESSEKLNTVIGNLETNLLDQGSLLYDNAANVYSNPTSPQEEIWQYRTRLDSKTEVLDGLRKLIKSYVQSLKKLPEPSTRPADEE